MLLKNKKKMRECIKMVNSLVMKSELINMTQASDKEKF